MTSLPDVLVVGAGPTGLAAALQAHDNGATLRVVERRPRAVRPSRAMVVHPRTLECLRPLGVTGPLLDRGDTSPTAELHLGARRIRAEIADLALRDTSFPHLTMIRQMDVEEVLSTALAERGVAVERGVELVAASGGQGGATAVLRHEGGVEEVAGCRFLVGCDGHASTVRRAAGIGWSGRPYREEVVLADVELDGDLEPGLLHVVAGRDGLVFLFALGEGATWRLLATRRGRSGDLPFGQPGPEVPRIEIQQIVDGAGLDASLTHLTWSARVPLQHSLADSFRRGPLFVAGDAAHAHSPAAAQGMNTGIIDAVNLGWKLAFASEHDTARHAPLLDSYEQERRPVARQVLALTHLVFSAEASTHPLAGLLRVALVRLGAPALPLVVRQRFLMAQVVRVLSQRWVRYRSSPLSIDCDRSHRGPRPGDRLPDEEVRCGWRSVRLHELTARPGVHVLVERDAAPLDGVELGGHVTVHRIDSWRGHDLVAVRPDGHVGFRCDEAAAARLGAWLQLIGAR